ncbi:MAG: hypothetical protein ACRDKG_12195 [Actinomycetota bacterium]
MNRTLARLVVPLAVAVAMMPAAAFADDVSGRFDPSTDRSAWYWSKQVVAPAGDLGSLVPSPQSPGSLPVALEQGQPEKNAAVFIDLASRGVPQGATITRLFVSILEESAAGELPGFEISAASISACPIKGVWGEAVAEVMTAQPAHDTAACVDGRRIQQGEKNVWTFDLLPIAADWDEAAANRGFLLIGRAPDTSPAQTWQVNLKRPVKDDPATAENEYEATKGSLTIALSYTAPTTGSGDLSSRLGPALYGSPPNVVSQVPPLPQAPPAQAPALPVTPVASAVPVAALPQIVWILVPLGLTLIGVMSWVVWEPDPHGRPLWMRAMGFDPGILRPAPTESPAEEL